MELREEDYKRIEKEYYETKKLLEEVREEITKKKKITKEESLYLAFLDGKTWGLARALNIIDGKE